MASADSNRATSNQSARNPAGASHVTRVLVVDDFPITRVGLCSLLDGYPGLYVVGEAQDAESALHAARSLGPELVVIDPVLADGDAYEALRTIRAELPEARILALAKTDDRDVAAEAIRCGANAFLVKTASQGVLLNAVQRLLSGEAVVSSQLPARALGATQFPARNRRASDLDSPQRGP